MFNLIVAGSEWEPSRSSYFKDRIFEHTPEELQRRFKRDGVLNEDVLRLPTIFMSETLGRANRLAHIGKLNAVRDAGRKYELEYSFDAEIAPITNSRLSRLSAALQIEEWEFNRTHWAIKDVDLFYVLLKDLSNAAPSLRSFGLPDEEIQDDLISVMMPFNAAFNAVYAALTTAIASMGLRCQRADQVWQHDAIIHDIVSLVNRSRIVICDLTGMNPNVFYETGIAHILGKDVILIAQSERDVPFDIGHRRYIHYLSNDQGYAALADSVKSRIRTLLDM